MLRDLRVNRIAPPRAMTRRCGLPGGRRRKPARPRAPPAGHAPLLAPLRAPALPAPDILRRARACARKAPVHGTAPQGTRPWHRPGGRAGRRTCRFSHSADQMPPSNPASRGGSTELCREAPGFTSESPLWARPRSKVRRRARQGHTGARVEPHRLHDIPRTSGSRWLPSGRGPCFAPRLELRARCPETAADHQGPTLDRPALGRSAGRVRPSGGGSRE